MHAAGLVCEFLMQWLEKAAVPGFGWRRHIYPRGVDTRGGGSHKGSIMVGVWVINGNSGSFPGDAWVRVGNHSANIFIKT